MITKQHKIYGLKLTDLTTYFTAVAWLVFATSTQCRAGEYLSRGGIALMTQCDGLLSAKAKIFDEAEVKYALDREHKRMLGDVRASRNLLSLYETMVQTGGSRRLMGAPRLNELDQLASAAPNFAEVVQDIRQMAALQRHSSEPFGITPILLLGDPGVGKTHFASTLAKIVGTHFEYVPMSSMTAGWVLSGAASQWSGAKEGKVADALLHGAFANPLMLLDEIDKASNSREYDPMGPLYALLEMDTAQTFKDEFVNIQTNASHVLWVATANNIERIPEPILKRMAVYQIRGLTADEARIVAQNIYAGILREHPGWPLDRTLGEEALEKLLTIAPRDMKQVLIQACGRAFADSRQSILAKDINLARVSPSQEKPPMGFVH